MREYVVVLSDSRLALMDAPNMAQAIAEGLLIREVWYYGAWRASRKDVIPSMRLATLKYELVDTFNDDQGRLMFTVHDLVIFDRQGEEIDRARYRLYV